MLDRIADFYRIVNPNPSDSIITQRRTAIETFVDALDTPRTRRGCIELATSDGPPKPKTAAADCALALLEALRAEQPSLSGDLAANALELRVCASLAVGDFLNRDTTNSQEAALLATSALATRAPAQERHLHELSTILLATATDTLAQSATALRQRTEIVVNPVQGADIAALAKSINGILEGFRDGIVSHVKADQEELNILWWVFGARSTTLKTPFAQLRPGTRALAAGAELAHLLLLPPRTDSAQFLHAILKDDTTTTLTELLRDCPREVFESFLTPEASESLTRDHPTLLPLTWIAQRRLDSDLAEGWESEFAQKTRISVTDGRLASQWALQALNEVVATRQISLTEADV